MEHIRLECSGTKIKEERMVRRENQVLSDEEIEALKTSVETYQDQIIVYGLLYTGMRVDELCHMKPSWIDINNASITIPKHEGDWHPKQKTINKKNGETYINSSARTISILNETLLNILFHFKDRKFNMNRKDVWVRLNQLWTKTGCEGKISPHYLRHTCLTKMAMKDIPIMDVAQQGGHTVATSEKVYLHKSGAHLLRTIRERGGI